jgi:hypothetical protein
MAVAWKIAFFGENGIDLPASLLQFVAHAAGAKVSFG